MSKFILSAFADEGGKTLDEQIAALKENGLTHLEPRGIDGKNISDLDENEAKEVRKKLDDAGIGVSSIGSPLGKIGVRDDFAEHMDKVKRTVETACILGTNNVRMFSFYIPQGDDPAVYRDEVLERLERMADEGLKSGVRMCHENEKGIYGDVAIRCIDILTALEGKILGVFDPANYIQCSQDTLEAYEMLKDKTEYFHIKDAIFETGAVVPAGKGDGNVEKILSMAKATGRNYFLTLEPHLTVFDGLESLEKKGGTYDKLKNVYSYPDNRTAFKAASDALHDILGRL